MDEQERKQIEIALKRSKEHNELAEDADEFESLEVDPVSANLGQNEEPKEGEVKLYDSPPGKRNLRHFADQNDEVINLSSRLFSFLGLLCSSSGPKSRQCRPPRDTA